MASPTLTLVSTQPRKPRLVDLVDEAQAIIDTLEGLDDSTLADEARTELEAKLAATIAQSRTKVDYVVAVLTAFDDARAAAEREAERLEARGKYFARQRKRLEGALFHVIDTWQLEKLEGLTSTIRPKLNPPAVQIDELGEIPAEYWRSLPIPEDVPDKPAIAAALKRDPDSVPGCRLTRSRRLEVL